MGRHFNLCSDDQKCHMRFLHRNGWGVMYGPICRPRTITSLMKHSIPMPKHRQKSPTIDEQIMCILKHLYLSKLCFKSPPRVGSVREVGAVMHMINLWMRNTFYMKNGTKEHNCSKRAHYASCFQGNTPDNTGIMQNIWETKSHQIER
jgi:hypothetical protein